MEPTRGARRHRPAHPQWHGLLRREPHDGRCRLHPVDAEQQRHDLHRRLLPADERCEPLRRRDDLQLLALDSEHGLHRPAGRVRGLQPLGRPVRRRHGRQLALRGNRLLERRFLSLEQLDDGRLGVRRLRHRRRRRGVQRSRIPRRPAHPARSARRPLRGSWRLTPGASAPSPAAHDGSVRKCSDIVSRTNAGSGSSSS